MAVTGFSREMFTIRALDLQPSKWGDGFLIVATSVNPFECWNQMLLIVVIQI